MSFDRPFVRAYVDETGDRGLSARSSRYFAMVAVVVAEEDDPSLRTAIQVCRNKLSVPTGKPLHWADHVKRFPRRQFVTSQLAAIPGVVLNYVIFEKAAIPHDANLRSDQVAFYNYVAGLLLERILLTARDWPRGAREVVVRYGHVRGFPHQETLDYFVKKRQNARSWMPWQLLRGQPQFLGMGQLDGLQAADQYAGMLRAALEPDEFGGFEQHHLMAVRHQLRRVDGQCWGVGFKVMALPGTMAGYPWWPVDGL